MLTRPPSQSRFRAFAGLTALALAAVPGPVTANTGGTMTVSATVLPTCNLQAGAMAFGALDSARVTGAAQAPVTLECTPGTAYAVTMDQGLHGGRRMADERGAAFLDYEIYQDAAGTMPWGATAGGAVSGVAPRAGKVALSAYGRVLGATATPGRYQDVVTVTVEF
jgi:spore coat protein U-like protein